jgi:fucose permease
LIGGWIADTQGFVLTFELSTVLSVVMISILIFLVKEPRKFSYKQTTVMSAEES